MKIIKTIICALLFLYVMYGCEKAQLPTYNSESNIYFSSMFNGRYLNTQTRSFAMLYNVGAYDSVFIPVTILGPIVNTPRAYKVEVDEKLTTAQRDKHYVFPADTAFVIPAGETTDQFQIKIMRDMYQDSITLVLNLVPNEHFQTNMPDYKNTTDSVSMIKYTIKADDYLAKPAWWDRLQDYTGQFTRLKLELMVRYLNLPWGNIYGTNTSDQQYISYSSSFQAYLNAQAGLGNVIKELDGTTMIMGPLSQ